MPSSVSPVRRAAPVVALAGFLALVLVVVVVLIDRPARVTGTAVTAGAASSTAPMTPSRPYLGPDPGAANVRVGGCVVFHGGDPRHTLAHPIDCAAPEAAYQVGYRDDQGATGSCPTQSYDRYVQTGASGDFVLCLMMNGDKGDCFTGYRADTWKSRVDCAGADAVISARLDGRVDPSICPASSRWRLSYPKPGRTVCLDPLP